MSEFKREWKGSAIFFRDPEQASNAVFHRVVFN